MTTSSAPDPLTAGSQARYAIYWAPPHETPLARLGTVWLGRDAETSGPKAALSPRPPIAGFTPAEIDMLTAEPRRYALHATLKPPFALAPDQRLEDLCDALSRFAASETAFAIPPLQLAPIGRRFLALIPSAPCPALDKLAAGCVTRFDSFRRPASPGDLARRRASGLDETEESNLLRWGYPYVLDRFRFHVTLTGPLDAATLDRLREPLTALFASATSAPLPVRDLALFVQPTPNAPLTLVKRFALSE
jgi:putative phosphonate metabolism protein